MTITYTNGKTIEGIILSNNSGMMRVALQGSDDVVAFASINGIWVGEDCEPVQVRYAWQQTRKAVVSEADCVCSKDLATRLIRLLLSGDESDFEIGTPGEAVRYPAPLLPVA